MAGDVVATRSLEFTVQVFGRQGRWIDRVLNSELTLELKPYLNFEFEIQLRIGMQKRVGSAGT